MSGNKNVPFSEKTFIFLAGLLLAGSLWILRNGLEHPYFLVSALGGLALWFVFEPPLIEQLRVPGLRVRVTRPLSAPQRALVRALALLAATGLIYLFIYISYELLTRFVFAIGGYEGLRKL